MFIKRLFDIVFSAIGLILLSPLFLLVGIIIKLDSFGPVFYRGVRTGRYGKPFRIFKFRSMASDAEKSGVSSTSNNDMRITKVGKIIRKLKLDEFSQLINVLIGDMSIVGPRPQITYYTDRYSEEEKETLKLRPGITDWASIKFNDEGGIIASSNIPDADLAYEVCIHPTKMKYQLKYLRERNIWVDLKIIFCTVLSVISTRIGGNPIGIPELSPKELEEVAKASEEAKIAGIKL